MMRTWIGRLFAAPVFEDEETTRVARLLNVVLLTFAAAVALVLVAFFVFYRIPTDLEEFITLVSAIATLVVSAALLFFARRGYLRQVSVIFLSLFWAFITFWVCTVSGIVGDNSMLAYSLIIVLAGLLLGGRAAILYTLAALVGVGIAFYLQASGLLIVSERPLSLWIRSWSSSPFSWLACCCATP